MRAACTPTTMIDSEATSRSGASPRLDTPTRLAPTPWRPGFWLQSWLHYAKSIMAPRISALTEYKCETRPKIDNKTRHQCSRYYEQRSGVPILRQKAQVAQANAMTSTFDSPSCPLLPLGVGNGALARCTYGKRTTLEVLNVRCFFYLLSS